MSAHVVTPSVENVPARSFEDFLVVPLRKLPPHPGLLTVAAGVHVEAGVPALKVRQTIAFGLPCAFGLAGSAVCGSLGVPLIPSR